MFLVDASALMAVIIGIVAALPAYSFTHRSGRGRARRAIAYLSGLAVGIVAAIVLFQVLQTLALNLTFGEAALAGSFFGPFVGLLWGSWVRSGRRKRKNPA
jgi:membrane associated rhomboid family serine protease